MDIYAAVTDRIIAQMEQGVCPWSKPWVASGRAISHATGKPYSLLNQMLLGRPGEYLTFKQCQATGGRVKNGEKAHMVVFWKWIEQEDEETGEKKERQENREAPNYQGGYPLKLPEALCHLYGRKDECIGTGAGVRTE